MLMSKKLLCGILLLAALPASRVQADEPLSVEQAFLKCKSTYPSEFEAKKRHACFDSITVAVPAADKGGSQTGERPELAVQEKSPELSYLERKWRLTSKGDWNISDFETYKSNYLLITSTNRPNDTPTSLNRPFTGNLDLDHQDVKFQFSLKTELAEGIPLLERLPYITSSRLWVAYTQQSYWQFFDTANSRPFRENDYEPELILSLGIDDGEGEAKNRLIPRVLNFGIVHQSNGRSNPFSRSWNRVYLQGGWELTPQLSLLARPWWRIPEDRNKDDNPDIERFLGYGDVTLKWETEDRKTAASVLLRDNLRADNKGFVQLDLQRQLFDDRNINLHFLLSSGYGESLLDYNQSHTTIGIGFSLGE